MSASLESTTTMDPQQAPASSAGPDFGASRRALVRGDGRVGVSPGVLITVFGGIVTALLGALVLVMMTQFGAMNEQLAAMNARIDNLGNELRAELGAEIGGLRSEMRAEIGGLRSEFGTEIAALRSEIGALRTEMQAGFREIHVILLDHTDRLARLEAHVGLLPRE